VRGLKVRTARGMVALNADEARALKARLAGSHSTQPAAETLEVSANASTSVTFTEAEKTAVLAVLLDWLGPATTGSHASSGLSALQRALSRDLGEA